MDDRDLPEGVINADPAGGWESGETDDGETSEQNREAQGSPDLTDSGLPPNEPADDRVERDAPTQVDDPDIPTDQVRRAVRKREHGRGDERRRKHHKRTDEP